MRKGRGSFWRWTRPTSEGHGGGRRRRRPGGRDQDQLAPGPVHSPETITGCPVIRGGLRLQGGRHTEHQQAHRGAGGRRGASGVIVHAFTGSDTVKAAVEAADGTDIYVVTEMSHPGGMEFTAPAAERLAKIAVDCGASGVIAPATRPERVKAIRQIIGPTCPSCRPA